MISGLSGSPAPTISRSFTAYDASGSCTSMRQTVGGAHSVVTLKRTSTSSVSFGTKRGKLKMKTHAWAFHGAKKQLHACFAQPGELMFQWTSPGCRPIQYIVDRWPTG